MPIKKAAMKSLKADKRKHDKNQAVKSELKTLKKDIVKKILKKDTQDIDTSLKNYISSVDKAAKRGVIHKKNASRKVARLSKKVSSTTKG